MADLLVELDDADRRVRCVLMGAANHSALSVNGYAHVSARAVSCPDAVVAALDLRERAVPGHVDPDFRSASLDCGFGNVAKGVDHVDRVALLAGDVSIGGDHDLSATMVARPDPVVVVDQFAARVRIPHLDVLALAAGAAGHGDRQLSAAAIHGVYPASLSVFFGLNRLSGICLGAVLAADGAVHDNLHACPARAVVCAQAVAIAANHASGGDDGHGLAAEVADVDPFIEPFDPSRQDRQAGRAGGVVARVDPIAVSVAVPLRLTGGRVSKPLDRTRRPNKKPTAGMVAGEDPGISAIDRRHRNLQRAGAAVVSEDAVAAIFGVLASVVPFKRTAHRTGGRDRKRAGSAIVHPDAVLGAIHCGGGHAHVGAACIVEHRNPGRLRLALRGVLRVGRRVDRSRYGDVDCAAVVVEGVHAVAAPGGRACDRDGGGSADRDASGTQVAGIHTVIVGLDRSNVYVDGASRRVIEGENAVTIGARVDGAGRLGFDGSSRLDAERISVCVRRPDAETGVARDRSRADGQRAASGVRGRNAVITARNICSRERIAAARARDDLEPLGAVCVERADAVIVFGAHSGRLAGDIPGDMHNERAANHVRGVYPVVSAARDIACAYRQVARSGSECTDAVISAVDRAADKARSGAGADDDCDGIRARSVYPVLARGCRIRNAPGDVDVETAAIRVLRTDAESGLARDHAGADGQRAAPGVVGVNAVVASRNARSRKRAAAACARDDRQRCALAVVFGPDPIIGFVAASRFSLAGDIAGDLDGKRAAALVLGLYPIPFPSGAAMARDVARADRQVAGSVVVRMDPVLAADNRAADKASAGSGADDHADGFRARRVDAVPALCRTCDNLLRDADPEMAAILVLRVDPATRIGRTSPDIRGRDGEGAAAFVVRPYSVTLTRDCRRSRDKDGVAGAVIVHGDAGGACLWIARIRDGSHALDRSRDHDGHGSAIVVEGVHAVAARRADDGACRDRHIAGSLVYGLDPLLAAFDVLARRRHRTRPFPGGDRDARSVCAAVLRVDPVAGSLNVAQRADADGAAAKVVLGVDSVGGGSAAASDGRDVDRHPASGIGCDTLAEGVDPGSAASHDRSRRRHGHSARAHVLGPYAALAAGDRCG